MTKTQYLPKSESEVFVDFGSHAYFFRRGYKVFRDNSDNIISKVKCNTPVRVLHFLSKIKFWRNSKKPPPAPDRDFPIFTFMSIYGTHSSPAF